MDANACLRLKDWFSSLYFYCFQVKDLEDSSSERHDADFITDASKMTIDWFQVFSSDLEVLSFFEVAIGTYPGGKLNVPRTKHTCTGTYKSLSRLKSYWTWNSIGHFHRLCKLIQILVISSYMMNFM